MHFIVTHQLHKVLHEHHWHATCKNKTEGLSGSSDHMAVGLSLDWCAFNSASRANRYRGSYSVTPATSAVIYSHHGLLRAITAVSAGERWIKQTNMKLLGVYVPDGGIVRKRFYLSCFFF